MSSISFRSVCRTFPGHDSPVVDKLDLDIADGEFMVLVGPSGCGKTTSLRMLAGLEEVSDGAIYIGDQDVTDIAPKDRDIAMVFQNYALYPHMSVRDNMGFALKLSGVDARRRKELVEGAAELLELPPLLDRKPKALAGDSVSAWRWAVPSFANRAHSSWTNRSPISMRAFVSQRGRKSLPCSAGWGSRPFMSPTTRSRR